MIESRLRLVSFWCKFKMSLQKLLIACRHLKIRGPNRASFPSRNNPRQRL